MPGNSRK
ncbi:hypothetical protein VULLAG_LOCUS18142 [Vulpes lagopus]